MADWPQSPAVPGSIQRRDADVRADRALRWCSLALFALCAGTSLMTTGPVFHLDEGSYLLNAAAIAGKLQSSLVVGYYSGYSLLLAPGYLLLPGFEAIYHYALIVNAALLSSLPFALRHLLRSLKPELDPRWLVLAAGAASFQLAILTNSQMALSENALIPLFAWLLAAAAAMLLRASTRAAVACGALAGALFLVHPRGATMALPVLMIVSWPCLRERRLRIPVLCLWLCAALVAGLHVPLEWIADKAPGAQKSTYSLSVMLAKLASGSAWLQVAFNALGVFTYSAIATIGLLLFGLRDTWDGAVRAWRQRRTGLDPRDALLLSMLAAFAGGIAVTAMYFNAPDRADQLLYGRYALPTLIPLLALGLTGLRASRVPARQWWWAVAITLGGILCMGLAFRLLPHPSADTWVHVNIIDLYIPFVMVGRIDWATIGFYFCLLAFALYSASHLSARLGVIVFALMNVTVAAWITLDSSLPAYELRSSERQAPLAVREFERTTGTPLCISITSKIDSWHATDYQNWLFDRVEESAVVDRSRCVRAIISSLVDQRPPSPEFRLIATEPHNPYGLFVRDSPALDAYAVTHALPPADFPSPLPPADRRAVVSLVDPEPQLVTSVGQPLTIAVRLANPADGGVWPSLFDSSALMAVRLGGRTQRLQSADAPHEVRADLRAPLAPGASATVLITLGPFAKVGRYSLMLGVMQESVAWFDSPLDATIDVVE